MVTEKKQKPKSTFVKVLKWSGAVLIAGCLLFSLYTTGKVLYARHRERSDTMRVGGRSYQWVSDTPDGDSLAVFCDLKDRRGFLNVNTGRRTIRGPFRHAWVFSEGLAAVVGENGKLGFIGRDGSYVIPPTFDYDPDEDYLFRQGICWIPDSEDRLGAIDKSGHWVLEPQFSHVWDYPDNAYIVRKAEGKDRQFGLLGLDLTWLLPPEYDNVDVCSEIDSTAYVTLGNVKSLVTYQGEIIEPFVFDGIETMTCDAEEEDEVLNAPFLRISIGDRYGVLEAATGKVILPPVFDYVEMASATLFACTIDDDFYEQVLYDIKGQPLGDSLSSQVK